MSVNTESTAPTTMSLDSNDISERYQLNEKFVNEEFKIWKKTSPLLYDFVYSYANESPALSLNWIPQYGYSCYNGIDYINTRFLMGTHSKTSNSIKLMSLDLPKSLANLNELKDFSYEKMPMDNQIPKEIKIEREWTHPGEVNKLQFNQSLNLIATHSNSGDVLIYDINDSSLNTQKSTLKFHAKEGFGLEWNPVTKNQLLTSAEDSKIALWDFNDKIPTKPTRSFTTHESSVNDIAWNKHNQSLFLSVSDDSSYQLHDLRTTEGPIIHVTNAHHSETGSDYPIACVDFNDKVSTLFATGGSDGIIQLWDLRNPTIPIRKLQHHTAGVLGLQFNENYLMSNGLDRRVMIWDLNKLEEGEVDKRKTDHIDPCLSFIHGGHTGKILSSDWHPTLNQLFISCADDDLIEVWKPAHLGDEYVEEEEEEEHENDEENEDEGTEEGSDKMKKKKETNQEESKEEEVKQEEEEENNEEKPIKADDEQNDVTMD